MHDPSSIPAFSDGNRDLRLMRILVVTHDPDLRMRLMNDLGSAGYTSTMGVDGFAAALPHLDAPLTRPDVIVMDLDLPVIDGVTATERVMATEAWRSIPIIMLIAGDAEHDMQAAFDAGALDYITCPPRRIELLARVSSALRLKWERDQHRRIAHDVGRTLAPDAVTGLAARGHFDMVLQMEWRRAAREEQVLSLMLIEVDFFKQFVDAYGRARGDSCLQQIAQTLTDAARRASDLIARSGAEQFAVLMPNTPRTGALQQAVKMCTSVVGLRITHPRSQVGPYVSISVGVACIVPRRETGPEELVDHAGHALDQAKRQGRSRVVCAPN